MPSPRLRVYARETAIAEKVEAMVTLGRADGGVRERSGQGGTVARLHRTITGGRHGSWARRGGRGSRRAADAHLDERRQSADGGPRVAVGARWVAIDLGPTRGPFDLISPGFYASQALPSDPIAARRLLDLSEKHGRPPRLHLRSVWPWLRFAALYGERAGLSRWRHGRCRGPVTFRRRPAAFQSRRRAPIACAG